MAENNDTVHGDKVKDDGTVPGDKVKDDTVLGDKVKDDTVPGDKVKDDGTVPGDKVEQASEWWMDWVDKAAATLFTKEAGAGMTFDCPCCGEDLRDPNFAKKVVQGYTQCPSCSYELKEFLTSAAILLGSTAGKLIDMPCPYCEENSPIASYGGNIVERFVICPKCRRDLFDPSAEY